MKKFSLSLLQKTLLAVSIAVIPLIIAFIYNYNKNREYLIKHTIEDLAKTSSAYEGLVYQFLEKAQSRVQDFSSDGVIRMDTQAILEGNSAAVKILSDYLFKNKLVLDNSINKISILSLDGRVLSSTSISSIGNDYSKEEFFFRGKAGVSIAETKIGGSELPEIAASAPIFDISTGKPIGVIANFINVSELNRVFDKAMTDEHTKEQGVKAIKIEEEMDWMTYLVNRDKRVIIKPMFSRDIELNQIIDTVPVRKSLEANEEYKGFYEDYKKGKVAGVSMCIAEMRWVLLVEADEEDILQHIKVIRKNMLLTASIVAGIIVVLFIIFFESVVKRIRQIADAAEDIARGKYNISIPMHTMDEIGVLSKSFNRMASEISRRTYELAESEKRLREAQHIAMLGNWNWDIVKNELQWSDEIYNIFGLNKEEVNLTYETFINFIHPDDREFVKGSIHEALYNKKPFSLDHRIVLPGGKEKIVHEEGVVTFNGKGEPLRLFGTIQDITELRVLERSRLEIQQRYEELINSLNVGIFKIDSNGRMIEVNKACVLMAETDSREELIKHNVLDLLDDKNKLKEIVDRLLKGETITDEEVAFITIKGNKIWTSVSTVLKKDDKGNIYLEGIIEEITEKKKLEDQLKHSQKMEAVGILAGGIAHDFNNILSAIMNYSNLLIMKRREDEMTKKFAEQILEASKRGAGLTKGILAFSRKQPMNMQVVDLNETIRMVEKMLKRMIGEDIELAIILKDKPLIVKADEVQIGQVLMNLSTNARDAMPKGGRIIISTDIFELDEGYIRSHGYGVAGEYAMISFRDTGNGMDEVTRLRIFEPFFTTKEFGRGTGLGLSISFGIVKQHNGFINVYSEPTKGTEFKIYLPLTSEKPRMIESVEVTLSLNGTETVLLAEDETEVRETTRALLEEHGYKVVEAVDGEDAVKKFIENKDGIKLIISDMIMPKKNGREAYDEIKKIKPDIKAVFMSGYTADLLTEKDIHKGLDLILKPVASKELLKKVRGLIDGKD